MAHATRWFGGTVTDIGMQAGRFNAASGINDAGAIAGGWRRATSTRTRPELLGLRPVDSVYADQSTSADSPPFSG
jgi:uncharacterized membrane protein